MKARRVLPYRLSEFLAEPERRVVVVEGEKDADSLARIGIFGNDATQAAPRIGPQSMRRSFAIATWSSLATTTTKAASTSWWLVARCKALPHRSAPSSFPNWRSMAM